MRSKSGKETVIGANKIKNLLNSVVVDAVEYASNNKSKNYILSCKDDTPFQILRKGYYKKVVKNDKLILSEIVSMKDSFKK